VSHLTVEQRYEISALCVAGHTQSFIAKQIGKDKSVISRELKRNADGRSGRYKADLAQRKYAERVRGKPKIIRLTTDVQNRIRDYLDMDYSPEQIAGVCKKEGLAMVSHERIYQYIWADKKQGGKLYEHLRTQGKRYRKRGASKDRRGIIKGRVGIEHRPERVEEKEHFGDLEIDTIIGKNHQGAIVTINDRALGILRMKKVQTRHAELIHQATIELLLPLKPLLQTITADNGKEFANHKEISKDLDIDFYFANPYHSWERGANENLNGLIRQYIPKKTDFALLTDEFIQEIQDKLNNRPRKRYGYLSPQEMFNQKVAFVT
jgi:IS30 family transposase